MHRRASCAGEPACGAGRRMAARCRDLGFKLADARLQRRDEHFRNWFMRAVKSRAREPSQRLLAIFDALDEWFSGRDFNGCMFINASAEFARPDDPIHVAGQADAAKHARRAARTLVDHALA